MGVILTCVIVADDYDGIKSIMDILMQSKDEEMVTIQYLELKNSPSSKELYKLDAGEALNRK